MVPVDDPECQVLFQFEAPLLKPVDAIAKFKPFVDWVKERLTCGEPQVKKAEEKATDIVFEGCWLHDASVQSHK